MTIQLEGSESIGVQGADRLDELYRARSQDAYRLAFLLTGDRQVAEDLTQEAFVRIGRRILGLKDPEHERAYLLRTVVNLSRSRGRKLKREASALSRLTRPSSEAGPEVAEHDETWGRLIALPQRQRAALFLRYYLDLSEAQAAETLACSSSALKSLVSRGLGALRAALDEGDIHG